MSAEITTAFVKQFEGTVFHLAQQKGSRLRDKVRNEMQKGESAFYDRLGSVTAQKKQSRHADTPLTDTPHSRRMVTLSTYHHADGIDNDDKVRMLLDPASAYTKAFMWALGRAIDEEIIDAADGTASTGKDGSGSQAHPNSQKIAAVNAGAGSNLNIAALRAAKKLFDAADVDESIKRYCAITSSQLSALLAETEITSSDYNVVKALVQGEINTFLGFEFIRTEQLDTQGSTLSFNQTTGAVGSGSGDANGYRKVLCWAQDGILLATGQNPFAKVDLRADKSYMQQVYVEMSVGAVRMEEVKVVSILCNES